MDDTNEEKKELPAIVEDETLPMLICDEEDQDYLEQARALSLVIGTSTCGTGILLMIVLPFIAAMNHIPFSADTAIVSGLVPLVASIVYYGWRRMKDK